MKITHVLSTVNNAGTFYGVESHVLSLAVRQKACGHDPMVATSQSGYFTEACARYGIPAIVEPLLAPDPRRGDRPVEEAIDNLTSHFTSFDPDLVHGHSPSAASQAFSAAERINTPRIFTLHAADRAVVRRLEKHQFSLITVNKEQFEGLRNLGFPPAEDLYFVPNGTKVMPPEKTSADRSRRPDLMLVGNLNLTKGIDVAILTMAVLRQRRGRDCPVLNIYGTTSDTLLGGYLEEFVVALGLTDLVRFQGSQPGIMENCPASDILMVPSRAETGPLVVLEAMSRGMPVVATKVGQVTEMLPDERYGRIVPIYSIFPLADAIEATLAYVASGCFDPNLSIARHRTLFSDEIMAERVEEVYNSTLQRNHSTGDLASS